MNKIEVRNLTKIFGKKRRAALEMMREGASKIDILKKTACTVGVYEASFDIQEGEVFVIMGLSGSGKSTLVRMLNHLMEASSGSILIDGRDISKMKKEELRQLRQRKVNMVFQNFGLFPHFTILENTEYGLKVRGVAEEERHEKAMAALKDAGLAAFANQYPDQLSGGMKQRVGLARALANDPEILLMDEAFSALDPLIRKEMQDELLDLQSRLQKTIVFITHDLNEALRIGDRIAIMKDGHIIQIGTGEEILTNPNSQFVEDFVEEVDRSKVLTAENIMLAPIMANVDLDGPHVVLKRMRKEGVSTLLAVDKKRRLQGKLSAEQALYALKKGIPLREVLEKEVPVIEKDMLVNDIFPILSNATSPVAVEDAGKLVGVIVRGCVIDALTPEKSEGGELDA